MTTQAKLVKKSCWCYAMKRQVTIEGEIIGERQATLLKVMDCEKLICVKRGDSDCLIGKIREGKW